MRKADGYLCAHRRLAADIARQALEAVRAQIRWKPGKDLYHLERRLQKGHLAEGTTLDEYEAIIKTIVHDPQADVFVFEREGSPYPTAVTHVDGKPWLVMVSSTGIMETAFVVDRPGYLDDDAFKRLGSLEEVMT